MDLISCYPILDGLRAALFSQRNGQDELQRKELLLIRLRWVAIAGQLLCIYPGLKLGLLAAPALPAYLSIVAALGLFNALSLACGKVFNSSGEGLLFLHLAIDLFALSSLLSLCHGCHNPMAALFFLNAALGPLILASSLSHLYLLFVCGSMTFVCYHAMPASDSTAGLALPREVKLATELGIAVLIWQLTRWVAGTLTLLRQNLSMFEKQKARTDNLRALGAMAASFSHEFATPLNTTKVRLERLRKLLAAGGKEPQGELAAALHGVNQCESVLRSLFQSDLGSGVVRIEKIALVSFIKKLCHRWQADHKNVTLNFHSSPSENEIVCKLPGLAFSRSLIDLLDNAFEASSGNDPVIEVNLLRLGQEICLEVSDRGTGMPQEVKARLGEPFISARPAGTGLGLFSAYALAEALGGGLSIEDRCQGGTTVVWTFPILEGK